MNNGKFFVIIKLKIGNKFIVWWADIKVSGLGIVLCTVVDVLKI
jgi:hypothetical protein